MILTLPWYIFRQHVGPFLFALVVITFVLLMDQIVDYLDLFLGKGVPFPTVVEVFLLCLGWMFALSIPMAVLVASLMAYGRLAQDHEITAMKAGGLSFVQIIAPAFVASVLLAAALLAYNDLVLPRANHRLANLLIDIHRKKPAIAISEGRFVNIQGYTIHVRKLDEKTSTLSEVTINRTREGKEYETIFARSGRMEMSPDGSMLTLALEDGEIHSVSEDDPSAYNRVRFGTHRINIAGVGSELTRSDRKQKGDREMSIAEMRARTAAIDRELADVRASAGATAGDQAARLVALAGAWRTGATRPRSDVRQQLSALTATADRWRRQRDAKGRERDRFEVEIQKKLAIPIACAIFILIGGPLGIHVGSGGIGVGVGLSLGFFLLYYLFLVGGEHLADRGLLSPVVAMWIANVVFAGVGAWLLVGLARQGREART
jgi:lipopolysaccharide export system permease protein